MSADKLTPGQRVLLAGLGGWQLTWALLEPDVGIPHWKGTQAGGTWVLGTPWGWARPWYQVGAKGIDLLACTAERELLARVRWAQVRAVGAGLTVGQRLALTAARDLGLVLAREGHDDTLPMRADTAAREAQHQRWVARHTRLMHLREDHELLLDHVLGVVRTPGSGAYVLLEPTETFASAAPAEVKPTELALFDLDAVLA